MCIQIHSTYKIILILNQSSFPLYCGKQKRVSGLQFPKDVFIELSKRGILFYSKKYIRLPCICMCLLYIFYWVFINGDETRGSCRRFRFQLWDLVTN